MASFSAMILVHNWILFADLHSSIVLSCHGCHVHCPGPHAHGYQAILHSCGAIHKVIGKLIEAGVDCLHPLQALAANMDAETLARDFKGRTAFMGGIDAQQLLVYASPEQVKQEVRRVKQLLSPRLIVSPSHEALLPNVPPQNLEAMAQAALD